MSDAKTLPQTDNYRLLNFGYPSTPSNMDMRYGLSAEGNPVVGWTASDASPNQKWRAEIGDFEGTQGAVTLRSLASTTYARAPNPVDGGNIVGGEAEYFFKLREIESGKYRIDLVGEDLSITLLAAGDDQQLVLKPRGTDANQQWIFQKIET